MVQCQIYWFKYYKTIENESAKINFYQIWFLLRLANLNHLILSWIDSQIGQILNKRIQRLEINAWNSSLKQLTEISYVYFSRDVKTLEWYANIIIKLLWTHSKIVYDYEEYFNSMIDKLIQYLDMKQIKKNFIFSLKKLNPCLIIGINVNDYDQLLLLKVIFKWLYIILRCYFSFFNLLKMKNKNKTFPLLYC